MKYSCNKLFDYFQYHLGQGSFSYCCKTPHYFPVDDDFNLNEELLTNHPVMVKRREELLNNIRTPACKACWTSEDMGLNSFRTPTNKHFEKTIQKSDIKKVEIILGTTCDAKCVYCGSYFSSKWEAENKLFNPNKVWPIKQSNSKLDELFWNWFLDGVLQNLDSISLLGGEPLIMDSFYESLERMLEVLKKKPAPKKLNLSVFSNMNTPEKYINKFMVMLPKLEEHFNVTIQPSGESTGKQFEYIRYGVSWDRWMENTERFLYTDISIKIAPTLTILCLPTLKNFLSIWDYFCEVRPVSLRFHNMSISDKPGIDISGTPKDYTNYIIEAIDCLRGFKYIPEDNRQHNLDYLNVLVSKVFSNPSVKNSTEYAKNFYEYIAMIDMRRDLDFPTIFPEFQSLYNLGKLNSPSS